MGKAIYILDKEPIDCHECELSCQYANGYKDQCPLKPIPDRKEEGYPNDDYTIGKADGWNDCIDAILGTNSVKEETE